MFSVSGPVSFVCRFFCRSSFLRVAFWKNFRERTFVFGRLCWSCVFFGGFLPMFFALFFRGSLPKLFEKNSLNVRSGSFWGRSLFLLFFFLFFSSSFSLFFFQET